MNNKTYTILQSFDKYEVNRLRKFLKSPYFNMNEAIVELFEIFVKDIFGKESKELNKEIIWEKIYRQKKYDDVRFRKLNSELLKLVEKFLAQQIYEENPIRQAVHLMEAVRKKKLDKLNNSTMRTATRLSNQQKYKPANYYFYQYEIEKNYFELIEFDTKREAKSNIEDIALNLDYFYFSEKLRIYNSILSRQKVTKFEYEISMIDEIIQAVKRNNYKGIAPIDIYYQISLINRDFENEEYYFKLKELINRYASQFPPTEANAIGIYALNYCVRKSNKGDSRFIREYLELFKDLLKNELVLEEGELSPWQFRNTILFALRLGEFDWVEKFIENYSIMLPKAYRDNSVTFNLARLNWYQKKHNNVIQLLREVEYEDFTYNLSAKSMLLTTYYEIDEIEPLYSLLESFRVYLNRDKKMPEQHKHYYRNLIKFTKKLTKIMPGDKKAIEKFKTEINETKGIADLRWLKEKITELE